MRRATVKMRKEITPIAEIEDDQLLEGFDGLLTYADLVRLTKLSVVTLYRAVHRGTLNHFRIGHSVRFSRQHLKDFLARENERAKKRAANA